MENMPIVEESAIDTLSPEKMAALDYALNFESQDIEGLKNIMKHLKDDGDTTALNNVNALLEQFATCSKEEERAIARAIDEALG
jgi:hypothetical protein